MLFRSEFIKRFTPISQDAASLGPVSAFFTRTLLIHEYRKVLLRDPQLPEALLPADWPGAVARQLCEALYKSLAASSAVYLTDRVISISSTDPLLIK